MKHIDNICIKLNGNSFLPLYSLDAGFIVTKTLECGAIADNGTVISPNVKYELFMF